MSIHPTAIIHPGATLGANVTVGPFCVIESNAVIGDGCELGPHVAVLGHTSLGEGCKVHTGAVLGDVPQDLGFKNEVTHVRIGKRCTIREYVTIHRGTQPGTVTEVGDDCFFMAMVHLAHNVKVGNRVIIANNTLLGGHVHIGDRAFVSGSVLIHQFVKIGRLAMVGGGSGLSKDVPPFCMTRSMEVNTVLGLNIVGMRRAGLSPEERRQVKAAFKMLYTSGLNVGQAVEPLKAAYPDGPASEFAAFIEASKRGICRFAGNAAEADDADGM